MSAVQSPAADVPDRPAYLGAESADVLFQLIGSSGLVQRGQAFLVSIAPVRRALGGRWEGRRAQIYDLIERHFRKHLSATDIWQRASETWFLVATPEKSSVLGQALCYRALKDVLTYFLGEVNPEDLDVSLVTGLTCEEVEVRPITVGELETADHAVRTAPAASAPVAPASSLAALSVWPLKTADGQDLHVSFAVDPVMDLKAWAMAGHRIESRIMNHHSGVELNAEQRRNFLPRDFETIDLAALERGMSRLADADMPDRPNLIIQLSFASLSNSRARAALLNRARELQFALRQAAICELVDMSEGVPAGRLAELTSLVRGFFRSVWIQVGPSRTMIEAASAAKASGLTVRSADFGDDDDAIAAGIRRFVGLVKKRGLLLTVTSLPSTDLMIDAMSAGFTHATLRARARPAAAAAPRRVHLLAS